MSDSRPTVRSIARASGFSVATVSEALRGTSRVKEATRKAIIAEAERQGYAHNALIGDVMSRMRRSQTMDYSGNIAVLETASYRERRKNNRWHMEVLKGARERAEQQGFKLEFFLLDTYDRCLSRLHDVLQHRGIRGIFLPPYMNKRNHEGFDWSHFSAVQMDFSMQHIRMHTICPDHHLTLFNAFDHLKERGYRRPGMAVEYYQDRRILMKWFGAHQSYLSVTEEMEAVPLYNPPTLSRDKFLEWIETCQPDVVIGHRSEILDWMEAEGMAVGDEIGFASLNIHHTGRECAGMNLMPSRLGAVAIEVLVNQIHLRQMGVPSIPQTISLEGVWHDGPTVRTLEDAAPAAVEPLLHAETVV